MQFKVKENSKRARIAAWYLRFPNMAVVFGSTIFLWNISKQSFLSDRRHLAHELCHIQQFKKYGFLRFLLLYLFESILKGYHNNRFEVEARAAENNSEQK